MSATGRGVARDPSDFYSTPAWTIDAILPHLTKLPTNAKPGEPGFGLIALEPCCGTGAIIERLYAHGVPRERVMAIEIDEGRAQTCADRFDTTVVSCMDFLAWAKTYEVRQHEHEQWTYPLLSGITSNIPIDETNARARRDEIERRVDVVIAGCEPSADDERLSWSGFDLIMSNPPYGLAMEFILESLRLTEKRGGEVAMLLRLGWLASETRADFHRKHPSDVYILPKRPSYAISAVCDKKCGWSQLYSLDPYARGPILIEEQVPAQASLFGEFANACVATAQAVAIEAPATCPRCRAKVRTSSSDSADYGWYVWGEGRGNRWFLLDSPEGA